MITAIINKLKTGSISNVYAKFDPERNLEPPYITVYEAPRLQQGSGQALGGFYISYHTTKGLQDNIEDYLGGEAITLLHQVILTDASGNSFRLEDTGEMSIIIDNNDDGTISRDRLFTLPKLSAV